MKAIVAICAFICLAMISGQAAAQLYGTKVKSGDPDVGLPLSNFAPIPLPPGPGSLSQTSYWISYWDLNANGLYDDQDVPYLQFGSSNAFPAQRIVRANNIRLAGWGAFPAGSYVKASDLDIGQQLNTVPPPPYALQAPPFVGFYYLNVAGSAGYDLDDPVYLKVQLPAATTLGTNDIRITGYAGFPAGSRVSIADLDAGKQLTQFKVDLPAFAQPNGGPGPSVASLQIGSLMFYNANGNIIAAANAIFDDGDMVYFHVGAGGPGAAVGPNDIRLF